MTRPLNRVGSEEGDRKDVVASAFGNSESPEQGPELVECGPRAKL